MSKVIMVQGTMSSAGKSYLAAGLCRIFHQDGWRVAPFKSQNMALNSFVTKEGLEMGRAQVMQAEAAGVEPVCAMNPILLKPTGDTKSQVIVNGVSRGDLDAMAYYAKKKALLPVIRAAFQSLEKDADIIVIEGAGSPAEVNLRENDIVNMGLAELVDAPVLLVGDIDRGGVFAQLLGTLELLTPSERARVRGLVINKFRGEESLLTPGIDLLTDRTKVPTLGVLPWIPVRLDDEDSLSARLQKGTAREGCVDIAVIRFPRISNFTDLDAFDPIKEARVRYVDRPEELAGADLLILPGSKNTIGDLRWLKAAGFAEPICAFAKDHPVLGICGGYQMLGEIVEDPLCVEEGGEETGLGLLPVRTVLMGQKTTRLSSGKILAGTGFFQGLGGAPVSGYEIHMGDTRPMREGVTPFAAFSGRTDGAVLGNAAGTYLHGLLDAGDLAGNLTRMLAARKGIVIAKGEHTDPRAFRETQYNLMAESIRAHLDLDAVYGMLREAAI